MLYATLDLGGLEYERPNKLALTAKVFFSE